MTSFCSLLLEANRLRRENLVETVDSEPGGRDCSAEFAAKGQSPRRGCVPTGKTRAEKHLHAAIPPQRHSGKGHASAAPIFVLGMPRSGSTLLEQILSSHAKVAGLRAAPGAMANHRCKVSHVAEPAAERRPGVFPHSWRRNYLARQRAAGWSKAPSPGRQDAGQLHQHWHDPPDVSECDHPALRPATPSKPASAASASSSAAATRRLTICARCRRAICAIPRDDGALGRRCCRAASSAWCMRSSSPSPTGRSAG